MKTSLKVHLRSHSADKDMVELFVWDREKKLLAAVVHIDCVGRLLHPGFPWSKNKRQLEDGLDAELSVEWPLAEDV